jgi:hypothetical protein
LLFWPEFAAQTGGDFFNVPAQVVIGLGGLSPNIQSIAINEKEKALAD